MRPEEIIADLCSDRIKDIIVDGDFGADGDDQFALGYALAAPDKVRVIAVTAAPYNENSDETVESGRQEAQDIVDVAGYSVKYGVSTSSPMRFPFIKATYNPIAETESSAFFTLLSGQTGK